MKQNKVHVLASFSSFSSPVWHYPHLVPKKVVPVSTAVRIDFALLFWTELFVMLWRKYVGRDENLPAEVTITYLWKGMPFTEHHL